MEAMAQMGILAAATVLAAGAAFGMAWACLRGAFRLMQPAGVGTQVQKTNLGQASGRPRLELVQGTRAAARAFGRS
jgi:hypothetical protein